MADSVEPEPLIENAVKQAPPEVEIVVDAVAAAEPIPSQEAERSKEEEQVADEVSEKEQLKQRELDEVDGSSIPAKYAEAVLAVDDSKGAEAKAITDETKPARPKAASLIKLFRYATVLDWLLMLVGSILAICHGVALPLLMLVFGDLTNAFINRDISQELAVLSNGIINCSLTFPPVFHNFTVAQFLDATNMSTGSGVDCSYVITPSSTINDFVVNCFQDEARCLTNGEFIGVINIQVFYFLGIAAAVFICAYFQISLFQTACERQVHKIRLCFYHAILKQEIGWFDANPSGELSSRLSDDIDKIHDGIGDKIALLIQWIATFFGGFIVGFVREWRLTLLLLAFTPFLALGGAIMAKLISSFASQEQKEYASAGAVAEEVLSSIRTVISFGGENREAQRYEGCLKEANRLGVKKGLSVGVSLGMVFFLIFLVDAAAFWFGGFLISIEVVQGGSVLTVFFAVLIGAFALGQAGPNVEGLFTAAGAAGTIFETIDRRPEIDYSDEGITPEQFDSTIEFKNVCFSYPTRPDVQVLDDFSLKVEVGKTFALVGSSGCGKSTVVQLLQRFYDVASGEILVGGKDVRELNLKWLRSHIGVVSQEPVLFDTTIADNIRYGRKDATMKDIEAAAKAANAHSFISELPNGYRTLVGERGTQLSGGQKQRIAIARALVRDPKILLLDEATSALDTESESIVQEALDKARKGRTTIVIAHRLSTIQSADVIASVADGQVVETGTHSQLMDQEGLYYELVTAQSYGADENFAAVVSSPQRRLSRRSFRRSGRRRHGSGSESDGENMLGKQVSLDQQVSVMSDGGFHGSTADLRKTTSKKQEEWDKDLPKVSLLRVIKLNAREWWIIIIGLLGAAVNGSIWPLFALLFGEILEVFARPADEILDGIHLWAGLFIVLGIVSGTGVFLKVICFSVSGENLTSRLRSLSFRAMLRQEMGWFDEERNSTGALTTRLANDAGQVQGATGTRLGTLIETFVGMIFAIVIAFAYTWVLSLVILGVVPIVLIAGGLEVKALSGHTLRNKKALETAGKVAVDSIENIRTVSSLGVQENFYEQYKHNVTGPYKKSLVNTVVYGLTYAISQVVIYLMYAVVFRFGAFQVTREPGNIAHANFEDVFVAFIALVFGAIGAGQAGAFAPNYAKAKLSADRIFFLLDQVPVIDGYSEDGEKPGKVVGEVETRELHFNYPARPNVKVLQGLNIHVKPGQTLALVGPSGCGKSTVVSLLERFYDPLSGCLALDDNDIRDVNIRWLRQQIGIVSQEPVLFDASIAENVRYGALFREVSDEEVIEATKAANIHSFIESLPQGYNTNVGAKGTQLSGGQKQRIAIARALIRDPKVLLLDEATSALDTESEKIVQEALDKAREGRTAIVIAHRLSTIYNADCIVVISGGRAVEVGTHAELMKMRGIYYKLNRYQVVVGDQEEQPTASKSPEREDSEVPQ